jgi:hypothetical protein
MMSQRDDEFDARPELTDDLAALYGAPVKVPAKMDAAILNRAAAKLSGARRLRPLRWAVGAASAAAVFFVVARVALHAPALPDDIDGNRRVDIVDALRLSHQINAGGNGRDVNGDGAVDQRDVDAIAMAAVRIDPAGGVQ